MQDKGRGAPLPRDCLALCPVPYIMRYVAPLGVTEAEGDGATLD